jgi:hypothetical protein
MRVKSLYGESTNEEFQSSIQTTRHDRVSFLQTTGNELASWQAQWCICRKQAHFLSSAGDMLIPRPKLLVRLHTHTHKVKEPRALANANLTSSTILLSLRAESAVAVELRLL